MIQFIDQQKIRAGLDYRSLVDALYEYHAQAPCYREDMLLEHADAHQTRHFLLRGAWLPDQVLGAKLVSIFPQNTALEQGLPAIQGLYVLFDGGNGGPLAVIDGTELTYWKTAGDSALGADRLAGENPRHMLMVGAGAMAPHLIRAPLTVRPSVQRITIWNRTRSRGERLMQELQRSGVTGKREININEDLADAVQQADLISCATMSLAPLIQGAWLSAGTHLDLVGAYTPKMREADDEVFRRGRIFVDSRDTTVGEIGEIIEPIRRGIISEQDILADLYDLRQGRHPGREGDEAITVYKNGGGGHLDLMTAKVIYEHFNQNTA